MTATSTVEVKSPIVEPGIYSDPRARKILQYLLKSPRTMITPTIGPTDEVRYPQLESIVGAGMDTEDLLSRMSMAGALVADLADKAPRCPECESRQISTRYLCPKCFSFDIERSYLYEHLKCGKVASDDVFKKGGQLICPKCQAILHNFGIEYRAVGAWYKCNSCSESFNLPTYSHFCRGKRHQFTLDRTRLSPIYQYRLNPKALSELRREVLNYSEALPLLEGLGMVVKAPHTITGKSGELQAFDIVATTKGGRWSGSKTVVIDVLTSESAVSAEEVNNFMAKVRDAKPNESYLIIVPRLSDEATTLAKNLRLNFIEGASIKEATTALLNLAGFKGLTGT